MRQNNKFNHKSKPVSVKLPIVLTGKDAKGNDYDVESCMKLIKELQDADVFRKLSVNVLIDKSLIMEDGRGTFTLARIQSIDTESGDVSLRLFPANKEYATKIADYVIVPRVHTGKDTTEVSTIFRFEIVQAMDA